MTLSENKIIIHFTSQVTQMVDMAEKLSQKEVCEILTLFVSTPADPPPPKVKNSTLFFYFFEPFPIMNQSKNSSKNYIVASSILDWLRKNTKIRNVEWKHETACILSQNEAINLVHR